MEYHSKERVHRNNMLADMPDDAPERIMKILHGTEYTLIDVLDNLINPKHWLREAYCLRDGLGSYSQACKKALERAGYKSEISGRKTNTLNCHHIKPYKYYPEGRCDPDNILVCTAFEHDKIHGFSTKLR